LWYGSRWVGTRAPSAQDLDWPRVGAFTNDGFAIGSDETPWQVMEAAALAALRHLQLVAQGESLLPDLETTAAVTREKFKLGPLESDETYEGGKSQFRRYTEIDTRLRTLLTSGAGVMR